MHDTRPESEHMSATPDQDRPQGEQTPSTEELEEPSTEKSPDEEPKAPGGDEPEPSHQAVGIGVIGGPLVDPEEPAPDGEA
jgi:hypothetical protein